MAVFVGWIWKIPNLTKEAGINSKKAEILWSVFPLREDQAGSAEGQESSFRPCRVGQIGSREMVGGEAQGERKGKDQDPNLQ